MNRRLFLASSTVGLASPAPLQEILDTVHERAAYDGSKPGTAPWQTPQTTYRRARGNCADLTIACYFEAYHRGLQSVRMAYLEWRGQPHMVLVQATDRGWLCADPGVMRRVTLLAQRDDLSTPELTWDRDTLWTGLSDAEAGASRRIGRWADLMSRM